MDALAYTPGPLIASARARRSVVAKKTVRVTRAGVVKIRLIATAAAKKVIRKKGKLKATLQLTFTPTGGRPNTIRRTVTFRGPPKKKH